MFEVPPASKIVRRSSGIRSASAKNVLWKAEEKWKARGWGLPYGGKNDNEYVLRGTMWADDDWLFCDNRERMVCMVKDIIEELLGLERA